MRKYRVFLKKVLHKREENMQEKMKMGWETDKNLAQDQPKWTIFA